MQLEGEAALVRQSALRKLIVFHLDDNPFELERVKDALEDVCLSYHFEVQSFLSIDAFIKELEQAESPDIVLLDVDFSDEDSEGDEGEKAAAKAGVYRGLELAQRTRRAHPKCVILMCSNMDGKKTIAQSLRLGADDFISKKSERAELNHRVAQAWQLAHLKRGVNLPGELSGNSELDPNLDDSSLLPIVGETMQRVAKRAPNIISSAIMAIHISGESGTGKEVVADLFAASLPPGTPFVRVNCGSIAPTLLESELFGHCRGAFTGAMVDKKGYFECASGGFIFLDEVATLTPSAQIALLRVLENQEIVRVGETKRRKLDVRVLSATNEPLEKLVQAGQFRQDLWQRLCEAEIPLPPLRERREEIAPLIQLFCKTMPGGPYTVTPPALEILTNLPWSGGNVRELRNCLRAMTEYHINRLLTPLSIPERILVSLQGSGISELSWQSQDFDTENTQVPTPKIPQGFLHALELSLSFKESEGPTLEDLEDHALSAYLRTQVGGVNSLRALSKQLQVSRNTLAARVERCSRKGLLTSEECHALGKQKI